MVLDSGTNFIFVVYYKWHCWYYSLKKHLSSQWIICDFHPLIWTHLWFPIMLISITELFSCCLNSATLYQEWMFGIPVFQHFFSQPSIQRYNSPPVRLSWVQRFALKWQLRLQGLLYEWSKFREGEAVPDILKATNEKKTWLIFEKRKEFRVKVAEWN